MTAKSKAQQMAAGAALSAKRGEKRVIISELKGASKSMYESMNEQQLEELASTKRKGKPEHKSDGMTANAAIAEMNVEMPPQAIVKTRPGVRGDINEFAVRATEACFDCAQACVACANACLAEDSLAELRHCIRVNLDCAEVCSAAVVLGIRGTISDGTIIMEMMLGLCAKVCGRCGDECLRHAKHYAHCRIRAGSCRCCAKACLAMCEANAAR